MKRLAISLLPLVCLYCWFRPALAQTYVVESQNNPMVSLQAATQRAPFDIRGLFNVVPNIFDEGERNQVGADIEQDPLLRPFLPVVGTTILTDFPGAGNNDNASILGYRVAPPDAVGDVGPDHYVQMTNGLTTIFDKNGTILWGPSASSAFWVGQGDLCEFNNSGDPVVLYDEDNDRWLVSQFALSSTSLPPWNQCIAISQNGDPLGAYNRYSFSFDAIGFNDYPKLGIASDAITIMARIFNGPSGGGFHGSLVGAIDKAALYAGTTATLVGQIVPTDGVVAGDYDNPAGTGGSVGAFFGSPLFAGNAFTIWELVPNFTAGTSTLSAQNVGISPFNSVVPNIPQPPPGSALDDLSGLAMHRLQIRDFGSYLTMMTNHTVNVGSGRAGIRWYELRSTDGGATWTLHQEGTYAPDDGENRWMGSIAKNAAGDIGLGFLLASSGTFGSIRVVGQTAAESATQSGVMDVTEEICRAGTNVQTGVSRSGDYSAMAVDAGSDTFWYTQEYFNTNSGGTQHFHWDTHICEFGTEPPRVFVSASALLEGPYVGSGTMSTAANNAVPTSQPYSGAPWLYPGTESVSSVPANVVDWALLELRTDSTAGSVLARQAVFLRSDGSIVDTSGVDLPSFQGISADSVYIVFRHRNHVPVMSPNKLEILSGTVSHDFTASSTAAYSRGNAPLASLNDGFYGLFAADANGDGSVQALDFNAYLSQTSSGATGSHTADFNLDGNVQALDFNVYMVNSLAGASSQVP